jgi:hypothetical protein
MEGCLRSEVLFHNEVQKLRSVLRFANYSWGFGRWVSGVGLRARAWLPTPPRKIFTTGFQLVRITTMFQEEQTTIRIISKETCKA